MVATRNMDDRRVASTQGLVPPRSCPVIADTHIYHRTYIGRQASGYVRPLVAGDDYWGISQGECNNSGGALAAKSAMVEREGLVFDDVAGVTDITSEGATVYASDDNTLTLTQGSNSEVGKVEQYLGSQPEHGASHCAVRFFGVGTR